MEGEDKYTPIHNDVLEALARVNLSPYETRLLFVIWRKTYGFADLSGQRKRADWIAYSQIEAATGISRGHISRAIKGLILKGIVKKNGKHLGFSKEFMVENTREKLPVLVTNWVEKVTSTGILGVTSRGTTKETITKEIYITPTPKAKATPEATTKAMTTTRDTTPQEATPSATPEPHIQEAGRSALQAVTGGFEEFWKAYPRKIGKTEAHRAYNSNIKRKDEPDILKAVRHYAEARAGQEPTYTKHAATFIRADRWRDWINGNPDKGPIKTGADYRQSDINAHNNRHGTHFTTWAECLEHYKKISNKP